MQTTFICFSHNLNYALGWMVVHSLWQATGIALLSGVLSIVMRKKTAKLRYLLSNAALVTVLAAAVVTFCIYYDFSKEAGQLVFTPDTESAVNQQFTLGKNTNTSVQPSNYSSEGLLSMGGLKAYFNRHIYLIVTIWALGVALFMLRLLGGISYVYYLKSRMNFPADEYWQDLLDGLKNRVGVQRGIDLLESALVRSPIVIGHLKPVILFPIGAINRLNPNEVEAILAHELAHVLRNDYVLNIIQSVIEALFYFHPAVWWISAQIRTERENCCDDVAIELCGNSMTYAKSLVSVQEMAYYGPQMAMAFAGQRGKNQLLMRVQRVLNQPQNKTNVREKLIATCLLVVLMVGLSFSSNRLDRRDNGLLSSNDLIGNMDSNTVDSTANTEGGEFLVFVNDKGELDSLAVDGDIKDGTYTFSDNTQTVFLTVRNKQVIQFNINGLEVAAADIPKFEKMINRIITPPAPPPSPNAPPTPEGMHVQSNGNQLNINDNGFYLDAKDDKGNAVKMSIDKNGFVMNSNGVSMNFSDDNSTYEADAKPIDGIKSYDKNGQLVSIVGSDGIIQTYNDKGELEMIMKPNGVIKNYKNKQLTTINKLGNGNHQNNYQNNHQSNYQSNYQNYKTNGNSNDDSDNEGDNEGDNGDEGNLKSQIETFKNDVKELRKEIKNCKSANNFDFRMGLIDELDRLFPAHKSQNQNVFNAFEKRFLSIQDRWKKSNCDDDKGYSYSYGTTERERKDAEKMAQQARKNAELDRLQAEREAQRAQRDAKYAKRDEKTAKRDVETAKRDVETAKRDAETAKRDVETAKRDAAQTNYYDANKDVATKSAIEAELRRDGYLSDGKPLTFIVRQQKVTLKFPDNSSEEFSMPHEKFIKYKTVYERVSGKKLFGDSDQRFYFR